MREYKYNNSKNVIEYRESIDKGKTWGLWLDSVYTNFKQPGQEEINKNYYVENKYVDSTNYSYTISDRINIKTKDNKLLSEIITVGENGGDEYKSQYIASYSTYFVTDNTKKGLVKFSIRALFSDTIGHSPLFNSNGEELSKSNLLLRPIITLNSKIELEDIDNDGVWEIK